MKAIPLRMLCVFSAAVGAGCVSSSPSVSTAAVDRPDAEPVTAEAAGRDRPKPRAGTGGLVLADAGAVTGAALARRVSYEMEEADTLATDLRYQVTQPPPMPDSEPLYLTPVRPAREAIWIEGYWAYTGDPNAPYEWMSGHWEIPPPDARAWEPSGWQRTGNSYVFVRGRWR